MTVAASANPLRIMTETTPTVLWNDSADPAELARSIEFGAVGATCNPVIALAAVRADLPRWSARIEQLAQEWPTATESAIGWQVVQEVSVDAARLLEPAYERYAGVNGRLSVQTDPRLARDAQALVAQAERFAALAPNIIVKIPATAVGLVAIEEATRRGISVNVTVSFTVSQAVAAGEAIERGLRYREANGRDVATMGPVVTIMCGRLDDWLKEDFAARGCCFDPGYLEWAGVAVFKRAYAEFGARGLRPRLLSAAYRNALQWTEFVGGEVVLSPPFAWQQRFAASGIELTERMSVPVDERILATLTEQLPDFRRAHEPGAMGPQEFDTFAVTRKTLRQFLEADAALDALVRDVLIPAP